jgi:trk system potassium uptake protein TrkH
MTRWIKWLDYIINGLAFLVLFLFLMKAGKPVSPLNLILFKGLVYALIAFFLIYFLLLLIQIPRKPESIQRRIFDLAIILPLAITRGEPEISVSLIIFRQILIFIYRIVQRKEVKEFLDTLQQYPARLLAGSFFILIVIGTILLALPQASSGDARLSLIDALFTATSATCVTGLIVVDTATQFSFLGEVVILLLIQSGGLGIMALSASAAVLLGKRLAVGQRVFMQSLFEASDYEDLKKVFFHIIRFTLISEVIGAFILTLRLYKYSDNILEAAYYGLFHSISAFCNAGFALWNDSLVQFADDPVFNMTISTLIILGGLGFVVIGPLMGLLSVGFKYRQNPFRLLSIHAQLVLGISAFLLFLGTLAFFFMEWDHAFSGLDLSGKLWASFFHSATARTAGFNTVDIASFQTASLFLLTLLMFIGASPGSTGGGIKTTTVATLALTARSMIRKRGDVEFRGRRLPEAIITKAISIFILSLVVIPLSVLTLLITEQAPFMETLFEVVSAYGTVGLSLGLTSKLTLFGKLSITLLMFIGRLGPLTVALIAGEGTKSGTYRYPKGEILIG